MPESVLVRPLRQGELVDPREPESEYDDFGPQSGLEPSHPRRLDGDGALGVEADGVIVGVVSWHWVHWGPNAGSRNPMIGIWLEAAARGAGVGTRAQRQLVDLFFRHTPTNRVEAHTDVENLAEQRALERVGFTREGVIRGAQWRNGAYRDGYLYSMLRADWVPAVDRPVSPGD
jgi:RimJ/RimL family protein N-acetyltransferase